jgi:hypothetical protein
MKTLLCTVVTVYVLAIGGVAQAEHMKNCKNIHGKVTVVTDDSVTLNDKLYKVGDSTRIIRDGEKVNVSQIKAGDIVCLDARGKHDIDSQIAAITVLNAEEGAEVVKEKSKETTKERTTERVKEKTRE